MSQVKVVTLPPYDLVSIDEPTLGFLRVLMELLCPRFVVEAGTYRGHFALVAGGTVQNQQRGGRVYTFDPIDLGAADLMAQHDITTVTYRKDSFDDVLTLYPHLEGLCDFVFIDSGDIAPHVEGERDDIRWQHYRIGKSLLRPGGLMVVDDVAGQWVNVETIRKECVVMEIGRGLALWQKPYG